MAGLRAFLPSWAGGGREEEAPGTTLVPFGSEPAHSFCLSAGACAAAHGTQMERAADVRRAAQPTVRRRCRRCCTRMAHRPARCKARCRASRRARRAAACDDARCAHAPPAQVGTPIPASQRLKFASELFDLVDIAGERQLDAQKLQARRLRTVAGERNLLR